VFRIIDWNADLLVQFQRLDGNAAVASWLDEQNTGTLSVNHSPKRYRYKEKVPELLGVSIGDDVTTQPLS
jgi:hypothetical protein